MLRQLDFHDNCQVTDKLYEELASDISTEEIQTAIKKLKTNKSGSEARRLRRQRSRSIHKISGPSNTIHHN
jgi:hypothetical protein